MSERPVSFGRMALAVERELHHNARVLPAKVQRGRVKPETAEMILRDLKAAATYLRSLANSDPLASPGGRLPPPPPHFTDRDAA